MSRLRETLAFWRRAPNSQDLAIGISRHPDVAQIRGIAALSTLNDTDIIRLIEGGRAVTYDAGARMLQQGEQSLDALLLLAGEARVIAENVHGEALLAKVQAPALLGEIGALADLPRTATVVAGPGARGVRVPRDLLRDVFANSPQILLSMIGRLGQHIQNVNGALGFYAGSIAALEKEDFDLEGLLADLKKPVDSLRDFSTAFERLAKHLAEERRKRKDMAGAALIQKAMLPQSLHALETGGRVRVEGGMRPAREVGGDFYDAFMLDDTHLALMIGDVSGKGVPASLFMSMTVTALRLVARQALDVSAVARRANALLFEQNAQSMFSTLFYGVLDLTTLRLDYINCGHNPPIVVKANGDCTALVAGGTPLGIFPERKVNPRTLDLAPGDCLFLYTDGVTESQTPSGEEYGESRLMACLRQGLSRPGADLPDAVSRDVIAFSQGAEQFDDITCLAAHIA